MKINNFRETVYSSSDGNDEMAEHLLMKSIELELLGKFGKQLQGSIMMNNEWWTVIIYIIYLHTITLNQLNYIYFSQLFITVSWIYDFRSFCWSPGGVSYFAGNFHWNYIHFWNLILFDSSSLIYFSSSSFDHFWRHTLSRLSAPSFSSLLTELSLLGTPLSGSFLLSSVSQATKETIMPIF